MNKISGIYKIKNTKDGKVYIGSSVDVVDRLYKHRYKLKNNKHFNLHLQRAWNRDGEESFVFEKIEEGVLREKLPQKTLKEECQKRQN